MDANPAEGDEFLMMIKIHSMPSFVGEVKPLSPCTKILQHVKEPFEVCKRYCKSQNSIISFTSSFCFATE
jgi:indole-3-glycerol phosphate synthase